MECAAGEQTVIKYAIKIGIATQLPRPEQSIDDFVTQAMWCPDYQPIVFKRNASNGF